MYIRILGIELFHEDIRTDRNVEAKSCPSLFFESV